jgi:hypothetical protein
MVELKPQTSPPHRRSYPRSAGAMNSIRFHSLLPSQNDSAVNPHGRQIRTRRHFLVLAPVKASAIHHSSKFGCPDFLHFCLSNVSPGSIFFLKSDPGNQFRPLLEKATNRRKNSKIIIPVSPRILPARFSGILLLRRSRGKKFFRSFVLRGVKKERVFDDSRGSGYSQIRIVF